MLAFGIFAASPAAQGQFWVLVNGALNYTGPVNANTYCLDASNADTCLTRQANGVIAETSTGAVNGIRFPNGANLEYGGCAWLSNFYECGSVTNGGTGRTVRIKSASTTVIISPGSNDNYLFLAAGVTKFGGITTTGTPGVAAIVAAGRSAAATAAVASVATFTVGAADASFEVSANVLVTTATTHSFNVTCAYTDEGNTARTVTLNFSTVAGVISNTAISNVGGAVPYEGVPFHIRAKAATAITIATSGTFTTVTYNVEGIIKQMA